MATQNRSIIAAEGWPLLIGASLLTALIYRFIAPVWAVPPLLLTIALYFLFRDPDRSVPPLPTAVLAPVDGKVIEIVEWRDPRLKTDWWRIVIKPNHWGAYTIRAPIEGTVLDVGQQLRMSDVPDEVSQQFRGLWLRSEEMDDVVLTFPHRRFTPGPRAFLRYGERVGQGHRFAYLRLAPRAEVFVAKSTRVRVAVGDTVLAGIDVLGELAQPVLPESTRDAESG